MEPSRELSIATLGVLISIIGGIFLIWLLVKLWDNFGKEISKVLGWFWNLLLKFFGLVILWGILLSVLYGIGWLLYTFIFGGFFGKNWLSYLLSSILPIWLGVKIVISYNKSGPLPPPPPPQSPCSSSHNCY